MRFNEISSAEPRSSHSSTLLSARAQHGAAAQQISDELVAQHVVEPTPSPGKVTDLGTRMRDSCNSDH
eukprot:6456778-Pyramimonas_sp.AAC.1